MYADLFIPIFCLCTMNVLKHYECINVCLCSMYICMHICVRQCSGLRCKIHNNSSMYVCMYVYVRVCLRCGGLWHVLCVLYGRWQLSYGMGRVGLFTLSFSAIGAPLSRRRVTVPYSAALCRAVHPSYNRDTDRQTDKRKRQMPVTVTGPGRVIGHG